MRRRRNHGIIANRQHRARNNMPQSGIYGSRKTHAEFNGNDDDKVSINFNGGNTIPRVRALIKYNIVKTGGVALLAIA